MQRGLGFACAAFFYDREPHLLFGMHTSQNEGTKNDGSSMSGMDSSQMIGAVGAGRALSRRYSSSRTIQTGLYQVRIDAPAAIALG